MHRNLVFRKMKNDQFLVKKVTPVGKYYPTAIESKKKLRKLKCGRFDAKVTLTQLIIAVYCFQLLNRI